MKTAFTCEERHSCSAESKANGMLYWRADSCAWRKSRRESAVTRQFLADAKPGIRRFTACNPKPMIPKLIIAAASDYWLATAIDTAATPVGADVTSASEPTTLVVVMLLLELVVTEYAARVLALWLRA
jgi:hypothetical protein